VMIWATAVLMALSGIFGGLNTLYAAFAARTRELGMLQSLGYKTGLYTSPHLESIRERVSINKQWIPEDRFILLTQKLKETNERLPLNSKDYATFFELITAMAYLHFLEEQVDFAVIETGMGGRLDATNVMDPALAVITHISMEHTDRLGKNLPAIADEKLGILRPHTPAVIAPQHLIAERHIKYKLKNHLAPVLYVEDELTPLSKNWDGQYQHIGYLESESQKQQKISIPMAGNYQVPNALASVAAMNLLAKQGHISAPHEAINTGLQQTHWPGRFEVLKTQSGYTIVLDVAHTSNGANALRQSLDEHFQLEDRIFVLGFLQDKDMQTYCHHLLRADDTVILTTAPSPRAAQPQDINKAIKRDKNTTLVPGIENAIANAFQQCGKNQIIIITGSLYLVGEVRGLLRSSYLNT